MLYIEQLTGVEGATLREVVSNGLEYFKLAAKRLIRVRVANECRAVRPSKAKPACSYWRTFHIWPLGKLAWDG